MRVGGGRGAIRGLGRDEVPIELTADGQAANTVAVNPTVSTRAT